MQRCELFAVCFALAPLSLKQQAALPQLELFVQHSREIPRQKRETNGNRSKTQGAKNQAP
jgi:hypothetical protein